MTFNEDGTVTIRIADDATGQDRLIYTAFNDFGDEAMGTVTITVDETSTFRINATLDGSVSCPNPFFSDSTPGTFSFASGRNRDATFTIILESEGQFSINIPELWQPVIGEPIERLIADELDEEGRPDFGFFRQDTRFFGGQEITFENNINFSFIDDSNVLRAQTSFNAFPLNGDQGCGRSISNPEAEND